MSAFHDWFDDYCDDGFDDWSGEEIKCLVRGGLRRRVGPNHLRRPEYRDEGWEWTGPDVEPFSVEWIEAGRTLTRAAEDEDAVSSGGAAVEAGSDKARGAGRE